MDSGFFPDMMQYKDEGMTESGIPDKIVRE